jgi:ATP-dependent Clp protease adaptor protein ClpS
MTRIQEKTKSKTSSRISEPPWYKVVMLNDDVTTMEFVVVVLMQVFHRSFEDARKLMMDIHQKGSAVCGVYPHSVAETKVEQVVLMAAANAFPLQCRMEEE